MHFSFVREFVQENMNKAKIKGICSLSVNRLANDVLWTSKRKLFPRGWRIDISTDLPISFDPPIGYGGGGGGGAQSPRWLFNQLSF